MAKAWRVERSLGFQFAKIFSVCRTSSRSTVDQGTIEDCFAVSNILKVLERLRSPEQSRHGMTDVT